MIHVKVTTSKLNGSVAKIHKKDAIKKRENQENGNMLSNAFKETFNLRIYLLEKQFSL
jgi:hypothetical protein